MSPAGGRLWSLFNILLLLLLIIIIIIIITITASEAQRPPSKPDYAGTHQMYDRVQAARFPASGTPSFELTFCCLPGC